MVLSKSPELESPIMFHQCLHVLTNVKMKPRNLKLNLNHQKKKKCSYNVLDSPKNLLEKMDIRFSKIGDIKEMRVL